jgi:poly(A) polymerase Pap1
MGKKPTHALALLRKHYPLLKHLAKCSAQDCQHLMKGMSDDVIKLMSQICINVMNKSLTRDTSEAVRRLTPYKKQLRAAIRPKTSTTQKRKVLEQKGGFIGALLGVALPLITSLITGLVSRK